MTTTDPHAQLANALAPVKAFFAPRGRRVGAVVVFLLLGAIAVATAPPRAPSAAPEDDVWQVGWYPLYAVSIDAYKADGDCVGMQELHDVMYENSGEHRDRFDVGLVAAMVRANDTMNDMGCFD